jgi:hypothetical protein
VTKAAGHAAEALLVARRLAAQQIARRAFATPAALVGWMGAVQAQDSLGARWAVGLRLSGQAGDDATDATIVHALAEGSILRTHVMRWTWQLVTPADLHWMLSLVTPGLVARAQRRHRELALDAGTFRRSEDALTRALAHGAQLTRGELGGALRAAGIGVDGPRLSHLLGHGELQGLICSGALRGKQATWALLADRAPRRGAPIGRAEALAELARRYFRSRGPATVRDFAWWSGLRAAEARAGLAAIESELASERIDGATYWWLGGSPRASTAVVGDAVLLPAFDEYLVAYTDRGAVLAAEDVRRINAGGGLLAPTVILDGQVVGTWKRTFARAGVAIAIAMFAKPSGRARARIISAAARYAAFLGLEANVVVARAQPSSSASPMRSPSGPRM